MQHTLVDLRTVDVELSIDDSRMDDAAILKFHAEGKWSIAFSIGRADLAMLGAWIDQYTTGLGRLTLVNS